MLLRSTVKGYVKNDGLIFSYSVAGVKDIDRYQEKITVSLHQACLSPSLEHIKLGVITKEELPVHYR